MKYPEIQEASLIQINGVSASEAANFPDSVKFIRKTQQKGLIPMSDYNLETKCIHSGYTPSKGEPCALPVYQSTTYKYDTTDEMGQLFDLKADGYFYTRLQNPTNDAVAAKIADLEGGVAAILTSSGQAANFFAVFNICEAGSHIVSSSSIYGGTYNLLAVTMKKMGVDVTFVDPDCTEEELNAAFKPNTKVMFGETIANPALTVLDIELFAKVAHEHGVPLVVDLSLIHISEPTRPY